MNGKIRNGRALLLGAISGAVVASAVGVAYASIPDAKGVIHGCYLNTSVHTLRVIDTANTPSCPTGTTALNWNQKGPAGPTGATGPAGAPGSVIALRIRQGASVIVPPNGSVAIPLSPTSWRQSATELDELFGQMTATGPSQCTLGSGRPLRVNTMVDGNQVALSDSDGNRTFWITGSGQGTWNWVTAIFEPGSAVTRTVTVTATNNCVGDGQTITISGTALDVVAIR